MGCSDTGTGVVDGSVGTIVWVRRRNGSWWPGKILGPDELSAVHVLSPRSGTPVKLLGREDASVDWYNLEKSKRVKAFRCGEFDDCIEKAEASLGMPPKKREKYARREDAILHALELEKELLEKKYGKGHSSNGKSSKSLDGVKKELVTSSEGLENLNGKQLHPKLHQRSTCQELTIESKNTGHQLCMDDDNSRVLPHMRGLQDFGLRTASSKHKLSSSVISNGSQNPEIDGSDNALPNGSLGTETTVHTNREALIDKRKRLLEGLAEESLVKRRDKRRPLAQVLRSSAKLSVPCSVADSGTVSISVSGEEQPEAACGAKRSRYAYMTVESSDCLDDNEIHPNQMDMSPSKFGESNFPHLTALSEENMSESTEDTETDSTESDTDEDMMFSDDAASIELEPKFLGRPEAQGEHGRMSSEELDDLALTNDTSRPSPKDPGWSSAGVSEWQLKGKRNSRTVTKRSLDLIDREASRGSIFGKHLQVKGSNGCDDNNLTGRSFRSPMIGYGSRGLYGVSPQITEWEDLGWNDQPATTGYWETSSQYYDAVFVGGRVFNGRMKSMLVDVDLKVQSTYQREHVPMISLMSKLNGQAIVGHPIQIEALENGSSESLIASADDEFFPETLDGDAALPSVWRTARRTANFRVPRPLLVASLDSDETSKHLQYADQDRSVSCRTSNAAGSFSHKASVVRKGLSRSTTDRKLQRKSPKKISLSSSQKTRTLSSIATQQELGNYLRKGGNSFHVDGMIKKESLPTAVTCIPVKLVFSRLHEALVGRHP